MRAGVGEIERERDLRIDAAPRSDPGRGAAQRMRPIGADHKPNARLAAGMADRDAVGIAGDGERRARDPRQLEFERAVFQRGDQMPVLDIVAEGLKPDLRGIEKDLGRAQ